MMWIGESVPNHRVAVLSRLGKTWETLQVSNASCMDWAW